MPATKRRHRGNHYGAAFAELMTSARQRSSLTQQALADAIGADRSTIIRWESGLTAHTEPAPLRAACSRLGISYIDALVALGTLTAEDLPAVAA